ncbi:glycoside hydrolase [Thozetella sp. PMI_491]|nr:glycoside hydrolase [Thozetella sp. PMI_491]
MAVRWITVMGLLDACASDFSPISASAYVDAINPGWNLGNTLDAIPDEGSWGNVASGAIFDGVKAAGFRSVRIPVTYAHHYVEDEAPWTINTTWLQRVSDVIDMATSRGLYVLTNMHHDSWIWADVTQSTANVTMIQQKFSASWAQIASKLACKSSLVAFEPINEPPANSAADGALINDFNRLFLEAIASSGGYNAQRVVTLVGGSMDATKTSQWFARPSNISNPWALQYHYYSPYDFIFDAWGKTIWGSLADKSAMSTDMGIVRGNFSDVPLLIGEFGANINPNEPAARWKYIDYFVREAKSLATSVMLWDAGANALAWGDPTSINIIKSAALGIPNSLPDSTSDASASSQFTSAYIFHRAGDAVLDYDLPFIFNNNSVSSITLTGGPSLSLSADYTISGSNITFKSSLLSKYISGPTEPGVVANFTVYFSAGASIPVQLIQWDTPTLSSVGSQAVANADLRIPVQYKGLHQLAAVKMVLSDGVYLADDWTMWLGPLQQARGTYNSQWTFDGSSVTILSSAVAAVIAAGKPATFSFEFYPRVQGNSVNYNLTV